MVEQEDDNTGRLIDGLIYKDIHKLYKKMMTSHEEDLTGIPACWKASTNKALK